MSLKYDDRIVFEDAEGIRRTGVRAHPLHCSPPPRRRPLLFSEDTLRQQEYLPRTPPTHPPHARPTYAPAATVPLPPPCSLSLSLSLSLLSLFSQSICDISTSKNSTAVGVYLDWKDRRSVDRPGKGERKTDKGWGYYAAKSKCKVSPGLPPRSSPLPRQTCAAAA